MNKCLLLSLFFLGYLVAGAQNSFSFVFHAAATDDYPGEIVQNTLGDLIVVGLSRDYSNFDKGVVWKISNEGDTLSKRFDYGDTLAAFTSVLANDDATVSIFGMLKTQDLIPKVSFLILKLDSSLNILDERIYELADLKNIHIDRSYATSSNIYIAGMGTDTLNINKGVFFKLDLQFNIIVQHYLLENVNISCEIEDILVTNDQQEIYIFTTHGLQGPSRCQLIITDTVFNIIKIKPFPYNQYPGYLSSQFANSITAKLLPENNFIIGGTFNYLNLEIGAQYDIGMSYFDTSMVFQPVQLFGKIDTAENGGFLQSIDITWDNKIFFAGTHRPIIAPYPNGVSWIYTGKVDEDLNLIYERWYGGDVHYTVTSIISSVDGGSYISAMSYDHNNHIYGYDLSILKLNHEGLITNATNHTSEPILFNAFPNPTSGYLKTVSNESGYFELINMCGLTLYSGLLHSGDNFIDVSNIPNGCYILKFVSKNKVAKYNKILKQS